MGLFDDDDVKGRARAFRPSCGISCHQCEYCHSPKLSLIAKEKGGVMFISDEPTKAQDNTGNVFAGSTRLISELLNDCDYPMEKVSFCFANACHGVGLSSLRNDVYLTQLESCHDELSDAISKASPSIIVTLGQTAWDSLKRQAFTGRLESLDYRNDLAFTTIPDQDMKVWLAPSLSPAHILQMRSDRQSADEGDFYFREFRKHIVKVLNSDWSKFPDYASLSSAVKVCKSVDEAKAALRRILDIKPKYLGFDYETDGIKVEREDLGIICVGLSCEELTVSMDWYGDDEEFVDLYRQIMVDKGIGKIAHHAKYESRVTRVKLGVFPEPWAWDSMYGSRVLYNRRKCGLKPQTYINFGIAGYDSVEWYLQTPLTEDELEKWGNNHCNSLRKYYKGEVRDAALFYVAQDAMYCRLLALKQMEVIVNDPHLKKGERLFRSLINPLVNAEVHGMVIDKAKVAENMEECNRIYNDMCRLISEDELVREHWDVSIEGHEFDFNSSSDLGHLLYDLAGAEKEYTTSGTYALDASTLERMPFPITDNILEARRIAKIRDTYLVNLDKEAVYDSKEDDCMLHAVYNLHVADTFRSSSSGGINLQNIPAHDKRALALVRSCIRPQKGRMIIGGDFRALEVTIGCSIHHDRNMLSFLESGGDMHRATLKDTFMLSDAEADSMDKGLYKQFRGYSKRENFCLFYGGGYKTIGNTLWKDANHSDVVMDHLTKKGIGQYDKFMNHIHDVADRLWEVQFPEYGQWRKDVYRFYQKHGYVELIDGFRCYGPLSSMQATNAPIQGPASHVLLWSLSRVDRELRERNMQSYIVNQIHDAMYLSVVKDEEEEVLHLMRKWMIEEAPNKFPWISAPLAVEAERTELREDGGDWSQEVEIGMI